MTKTHVYNTLPRGFGQLLGITIRNSWLLLHEHPRVIGIKFGSQNLFGSIPDSTSVVADIVMSIASLDYVIDEAVLASSARAQVFEAQTFKVYEYNVPVTGTVFTAGHLAPVIKSSTPEEPIIERLYESSTDNFLSFYIKTTSMVTSEEVNKSYLTEAGVVDTNVIAIASTNKPHSKVTYSVVDTGVTEELSVTFEGVQEDFETFKKIISETLTDFLKIWENKK